MSPLGPSAVNPDQLVHTGYGTTEPTQVPKAMSVDEIRRTIKEFKHDAKVARDAGFDGVQIQGGFVYLFQQFLQENLNRRTDEYGGSIENRARLLFEVLEAILDVWPSSRVGVKPGPMMPERGGFRSSDSTIPTTEFIYHRLNDYRLALLIDSKIEAAIGSEVHRETSRERHFDRPVASTTTRVGWPAPQR